MWDYGTTHAISEIIPQVDVRIKKLVRTRGFFFLMGGGGGGKDVYGPKPPHKRRFRTHLKNMIRVVYKNMRSAPLSWRVHTQFFCRVNGLSEEFPINRASLSAPSWTEETETSLCIFLSPLFYVSLKKFQTFQSLGNTVFLESKTNKTSVSQQITRIPYNINLTKPTYFFFFFFFFLPAIGSSTSFHLTYLRFTFTYDTTQNFVKWSRKRNFPLGISSNVLAPYLC